jgi:hypothetical protein
MKRMNLVGLTDMNTEGYRRNIKALRHVRQKKNGYRIDVGNMLEYTIYGSS